MATGRGGRKAKSEEEQRTQVVKTTLTQTELAGLQHDYSRHTAGQKISFAEYIRQQLLTKAARSGGAYGRSDLLATQLELAAISEQLNQILDEIRPEVSRHLSGSRAADATQDDDSAHQLPPRLNQQVDRIDAVIKHISQWLYDCSPEKI